MGKKVRLRKGEAGYALVLVLILLILIGLIIGPLLLLMTTSLMSAYRHEEGMLGFYAADAGIEDAAYKIQNEDPSLPDIGGTYTYFIKDEYDVVLEINDSAVEVTIEGIDDPSDEVYKITSTATSSNGDATVESYIKADRVDLSGLADNAISSNNDVTLQPGSQIYGDIQYDGDPPIDPDQVDGDITTDPIEYWPTAEQLSAYFWEDVKDETPFASDTIDVDDYSGIGPLYRDGNLNVDNTGDPGTLQLNGTVYVTGNLIFDQPGTPNAYTIALNGQTIYVEGNITFPADRVAISGPGAIIAVGDITFQPSISGADFVFVMSIEGWVWFKPQGDFYGSVAGDVEVQLQPNTTLTWVDPEGAGYDLPAGGKAVLDIRTYTIQ